MKEHPHEIFVLVFSSSFDRLEKHKKLKSTIIDRLAASLQHQALGINSEEKTPLTQTNYMKANISEFQQSNDQIPHWI